MKLESQKDMGSLKNKDIQLNTIGRNESSEDEEMSFRRMKNQKTIN